MKRPSFLILIIVGVAFHLLAALQIKERLVVRDDSGRGGTVQDFAYYYLLGSALAERAINNPYDIHAQQSVMSSALATPVDRVLALGPSPTIFLFLAPLLSLSLGNAYLIWLLFCVISFAIAVLYTLGRTTTDTKTLLVIAASPALMMPIAMTATILGQTSLLALGSLILLGATTLPVAVVLAIGVVLSIKPPYLLLGVIALAACDQARRIPYLLLGAAVAVGTILSILGFDVGVSYLTQLQAMAAKLPHHYANSIDLSVIGTFRGIIAQVTGEDIAGPMSSVNYALLSCVALFVAYRGGRTTALILGFAAYLLFAPYAGRYEDLLILAPLWIAIGTLDLSTLRAKRCALAAVVFAYIPLLELMPAITFTAKFLALGTLWLAYQSGPKHPMDAPLIE